MLSNQCLITLPEVRTKGLVPEVRHTRLRLSVNKVEGHVSLTGSRVRLGSPKVAVWTDSSRTRDSVAPGSSQKGG